MIIFDSFFFLNWDINKVNIWYLGDFGWFFDFVFVFWYLSLLNVVLGVFIRGVVVSIILIYFN